MLNIKHNLIIKNTRTNSIIYRPSVFLYKICILPLSNFYPFVPSAYYENRIVYMLKKLNRQDGRLVPVPYEQRTVYNLWHNK